jgi:hypothetical protein
VLATQESLRAYFRTVLVLDFELGFQILDVYVKEDGGVLVLVGAEKEVVLLDLPLIERLKHPKVLKMNYRAFKLPAGYRIKEGGLLQESSLVLNLWNHEGRSELFQLGLGSLEWETLQDSSPFLEERCSFNFGKFFQQVLPIPLDCRRVKADCGELSGLKTGRLGLVTVLEDKRKLAVCDVEAEEEDS